MMTVQTQIAEIAEKLLDEDLFLVDVIIKGKNTGKKVIVLVDGDNGISIDQCAKISRQLSNELDEAGLVESGAYQLEVSSPGLDHPIKLKRQYIKNLGRNLDVETDEEKFIGKLIGAEEELTLEVTVKKQVNTIKIPLDRIKKANVLVSFK